MSLLPFLYPGGDQEVAFFGVRMKEIIGDTLLIAFFVILTVNFSLLWIGGGEVLIYEHNKAILILETVMAVGIGIIGLERLINDLRK